MEDLTDVQTAELQRMLHTLHEELEEQLTATRDGARPVDLDEPIGRVSRMDAMQQQQMTHAHRRRAELRLQQVQAALGRIERGDYGECLVCGEPIGYKRLAIKPESPTCVRCQSEREQ